jgi:hypothetical protein
LLLLLLRSSSPTIAEAAKRWCRLLCRAVDAVLRQKILLPTTEEDVETSAAKPTDTADAAVFAAALAAARLISLSLHRCRLMRVSSSALEVVVC